MVRIVDDRWDANRGLLKRLEALLALWIHPPYWRPFDDNYHQAVPHDESNAIEPDDSELWATFLARSDVFPPYSNAEGLRRALRAEGRSARDRPVRELRDAGDLLVIGNRIVFKELRAKNAPKFGRGWCFRIAYEPRLDELLEKKFHVVARLGDDLLAQEPKSPYDPKTAAELTVIACRETSNEGLRKALFKALALNVESPVVDALPVSVRFRAGALLGTILERACRHLHWSTDYQLGMFRRHERLVERPTSESGSRMAALVEADVRLAPLGGHLGGLLSTDFLADVAGLFALTASTATLGNVTAALPPGRALLRIGDVLVRFRPTVLANLLFHPSWATEAAFFVATFLGPTRDSHFRDIDLSAEWAEVQELVRQQLLIARRDDTSPSLDLMVRDEAREWAAKNAVRGQMLVTSTSRLRAWRATWPSLSLASIAMGLDERLADGKESQATAVVTLRLLGLFPSDARDEIGRIGLAFVSSYEKSCNGREPSDFRGNGELLAQFYRLVDESNRARLRRPFDVEGVLAKACADLERDGASIDAALKIPRVLKLHVENLLALCPHLDADLEIVVLRTVVDIFLQERRVPFPLPTFTWRADFYYSARESSEPTIVQLAARLAVLGERGLELLRSLERANLSLLERAQLVWGLPEGHAYRATVLTHVNDLAANAIHEDVSFGDAADLALALLQCGQLGDAAKFARTALALEDRGQEHPVGYVASQVLWAALYGQEEFEALLMEPANKRRPSYERQVHLDNWQALALLRQGASDQALARLDAILKRDKKNKMALSHRVSALIQEERWDDAIASADVALEALGMDAPGVILANKARALTALARRHEAAETLRRIPEDEAATPPMVALRVNLLLSSTPDVERLERDIAAVAMNDPTLAAELRQKLRPLTASGMAAAWFIQDSPARPHGFENACAAEGVEPDDVLVDAFIHALDRLAGAPSLASKLSEDQLTRVMTWGLDGLQRFRVTPRVLTPGGHGEKSEGVADFALEGPETFRTRTIVRGEAKLWDGANWLRKGVGQVFGVSNTATERFLAVVVYSDRVDFPNVVTEATKVIRNFEAGTANESFFRMVGDVEQVRSEGAALRVLRSRHAIHANTDFVKPQTVYTFIVDIMSRPAKAARTDIRNGDGTA